MIGKESGTDQGSTSNPYGFNGLPEQSAFDIGICLPTVIPKGARDALLDDLATLQRQSNFEPRAEVEHSGLLAKVATAVASFFRH